VLVIAVKQSVASVLETLSHIVLIRIIQGVACDSGIVFNYDKGLFVYADIRRLANY
jgi:hypothetical protein